MNRTYFEWYEFDVNDARILSATCASKTTLKRVSMNELKYIAKFRYC